MSKVVTNKGSGIWSSVGSSIGSNVGSSIRSNIVSRVVSNKGSSIWSSVGSRQSWIIMLKKVMQLENQSFRKVSHLPK